MNHKDGVLIFDPNYSAYFVKNISTNIIEWNGDFIGDITKLSNKIPALKGKKIFYFYPNNEYIILEKYNTQTHIIEMIKRIFELKMIPYNICIYRKKYYFMYKYIPFTYIQYNPNKKKSNEINDQERLIYIFYWLLGIKGKVCKTIDGNISFSMGKYSIIDYSKNNMKDSIFSRYFSNYDELYKIVSYFNNEERIDSMRSLFSLENYWWFQEIQKRIENIIPIDFSKK